MSNILKQFRAKSPKTNVERWAIHIIDTLNKDEIKNLVKVLNEIMEFDSEK